MRVPYSDQAPYRQSLRSYMQDLRGAGMRKGQDHLQRYLFLVLLLVLSLLLLCSGLLYLTLDDRNWSLFAQHLLSLVQHILIELCNQFLRALRHPAPDIDQRAILAGILRDDIASQDTSIKLQCRGVVHYRNDNLSCKCMPSRSRPVVHPRSKRFASSQEQQSGWSLVHLEPLELAVQFVSLLSATRMPH
jgi:hypothetical protein